MSYTDALIQKYREPIRQRLEVAEKENQPAFLISSSAADTQLGCVYIPEAENSDCYWSCIEAAVRSIIDENENKNYSYTPTRRNRCHNYTRITFFLDPEYKKLREREYEKDEEERIECMKNKILEEKKKKKEERVEKFKDNFAEHVLPGLITSLPGFIITVLSIIFK